LDAGQDVIYNKDLKKKAISGKKRRINKRTETISKGRTGDGRTTHNVDRQTGSSSGNGKKEGGGRTANIHRPGRSGQGKISRMGRVTSNLRRGERRVGHGPRNFWTGEKTAKKKTKTGKGNRKGPLGKGEKKRKKRKCGGVRIKEAPDFTQIVERNKGVKKGRTFLLLGVKNSIGPQ